MIPATARPTTASDLLDLQGEADELLRIADELDRFADDDHAADPAARRWWRFRQLADEVERIARDIRGGIDEHLLDDEQATDAAWSEGFDAALTDAALAEDGDEEEMVDEREGTVVRLDPRRYRHRPNRPNPGGPDASQPPPA